MNSISGSTIVDPSGIEAATSPISPDTFAPTATAPVSTPSSRANDARASSVACCQCSQLVLPVRHSSRAAWSASQAGRGGRPKLAVFRYVPAGSHRSAAESIDKGTAPFSYAALA